jgi:hypothetical protein
MSNSDRNKASMKNKKHTEDCIDANDDTSVLKGVCICEYTQPLTPTHTPTPWKVEEYMHALIVKNAKFEDVFQIDIAAPNADTNAAFIVRAVNAYSELLTDAKVNAQWFEDNGYPTEAANIRRMIAKAEGL